MKITDIRTGSANPYIPNELRVEDVKLAASKAIGDKIEISKSNNVWQKDILLSALDMLENNMQVKNSAHPLDQTGNQPIETYREALVELRNLINSPKYAHEALGAQANIKNEDILSLFAGETIN